MPLLTSPPSARHFWCPELLLWGSAVNIRAVQLHLSGCSRVALPSLPRLGVARDRGAEATCGTPGGAKGTTRACQRSGEGPSTRVCERA